VDGDSTDNPKFIASVFNDYFLSGAEKTLPQVNDDDNKQQQKQQQQQ
jgi:hypothetical protein